MRLTILTLIVGVLVVGLIFELLRRRQLREKYAVLWLLVAGAVFPLAAFPRALDYIAGFVGVAEGVSLALFLGLVLVLLICLHLTWETSRLEEETRTLAEEVALMRIRLDLSEAASKGRSAPGSADAPPAWVSSQPGAGRFVPNQADRFAPNQGASGADY